MPAVRGQPHRIQGPLWRRVAIAISVGLVLLLSVILGAGFLLLLLPFLVVAIPVLLCIDWGRKRLFLTHYAGQSFLVAGWRRGWREFVANNVEPAMPSGMTCLWDRTQPDRSSAQWFLDHRIKRPAGLRRPYLVAISRTERSLRFVPLHDVLLPLKPQAKRSVETQRQVAEVLEYSLRDLA